MAVFFVKQCFGIFLWQWVINTQSCWPQLLAIGFRTIHVMHVLLVLLQQHITLLQNFSSTRMYASACTTVIMMAVCVRVFLTDGDSDGVRSDPGLILVVVCARSSQKSRSTRKCGWNFSGGDVELHEVVP